MIKKLKKILDKHLGQPLIIRNVRSAEGIDTRITSFVERHSLVAEQYKSLRTNLYYLSPDKPLKAILITSSQEKEGKSVTASNLAFTLSLDDFVISFFTSGPASVTLPLYIYGSLRRGITPDIHALSTIVFLVTVALVLGLQVLARNPREE